MSTWWVQEVFRSVLFCIDQLKQKYQTASYSWCERWTMSWLDDRLTSEIPACVSVTYLLCICIKCIFSQGKGKSKIIKIRFDLKTPGFITTNTAGNIRITVLISTKYLICHVTEACSKNATTGLTTPSNTPCSSSPYRWQADLMICNKTSKWKCDFSRIGYKK